MREMDPMVLVYYGMRGSGKTLSMTAKAVRTMAMGGNVWSNYDIHFGIRERDGSIRLYRSKPVDLDDILTMQRNNEIKDGLVMLDEWNLWCNSRRSAANANYIFNGVVQLIRKRNLSFAITTQEFFSLDKMIRHQCNISFDCFDLYYKHRWRYGKGEMIEQKWIDWTGMKTGRPLTSRDDRETIWNAQHSRIFKGKKYHGCYDTGFEFDVLEVMTTKYSLESTYKTVTRNGLKSQHEEMLKEKVAKIANPLPVGTIFTRDEMMNMLAEENLTGSMQGKLGQAVTGAGFKRKRKWNGAIEYVLENKLESETDER